MRCGMTPWHDLGPDSKRRLPQMVWANSWNWNGRMVGEPACGAGVCDMIEEYGRHTGHADLIRESVDGVAGEDPPDGWQPG